jgi:iron(III) transport system substrate-binding protein
MNTARTFRNGGGTVRRASALSLAAAAALALTACAPPGASTDGDPVENTLERPEAAADETADGFDLDALIEAAQKEGPITIYDETGKVVQIAEAFTEEYGIQATGVKIETNVVEKAVQEFNSGNIIGDVIANMEVPAFYSEMLADDILVNWVPGDVYDSLPEYATYPYLTSDNQAIWTYNSEVHGDTCPVTNIWQLADPEWDGSVAIPDPESRAVYTTIWNQAAREHADEYEAAYEEYFGEPLETDQPSAVHEWVARFAANNPTVFKNDEEVSDAVGASGQSEPPVGLMYAAKYRNNDDKGYSLAPCEGMQPFAGASTPQTMAYSSKTDSPNAAKLYIYFATHQQGMDFIMPDGKSSFSPAITLPDDAYGVLAMREAGEFQPFSTTSLQDDYAKTVAWQDLWRSSR